MVKLKEYINIIKMIIMKLNKKDIVCLFLFERNYFLV